MPGSPEKTPAGAPEKQPQQKTQAEKGEEQHKKLSEQLKSIRESKEKPAEKLNTLKRLYEDQLIFELNKNTTLSTRQDFNTLQQNMMQGMKERLKSLEEQYAEEPTEDLKRAVEIQKEKVLHLEETKKYSGSISRRRKRILRRIAVYESPQIKEVREVIKKQLIILIDNQVSETDKAPFKKSLSILTEKIAELDMKDDTHLLNEVYAELYQGATLGKFKEQLDALREKTEKITEEKRKQAFDLFIEVKFAEIAKKNTSSVLTEADREAITFDPEELNDPEKKTQHEQAIKKLMKNFAEKTKYAFGKFLTEQQLEHLAPQTEEEYLEFCTKNETAITTELFKDRTFESKTDRDVKMLKTMKEEVAEKRKTARNAELNGDKKTAREIRQEADMIEDFQENFELSLKNQAIPQRGVTFDLLAKIGDLMPRFRDLNASDLLVKTPLLFMGLSTIAANTFPLGKDVYMRVHNNIFKHLTVNPFKWPKMLYKVGTGSVKAGLGIVKDTLSWTFTDYSAVSAIVLGGGMTALTASPDLRKKATSALSFAAKEFTGMGPVAGLFEQINDFTHNAGEKISKHEYTEKTKSMIYTYLWKLPKEKFDKIAPEALEFFDYWDIKIDEVKEHQQSVVDTEKALEAIGYTSAKSLTVSYEKYNSFLLHYLPEKPGEDYEMPMEVLRDIGFFVDSDDIGEKTEVDYSETIDTYHAMQVYADKGKAPNMKDVLKGDERAWYNPMRFITDPTQVLATEVFGITPRDEGLKAVTPEAAQDVWSALTASDKHPMRYMTVDKVKESIGLQADRLIDEMGKQEVEEEVSVDEFIGSQLLDTATEKQLVSKLSEEWVTEAPMENIIDKLNTTFQLISEDGAPLEDNEMNEVKLKRKVYLTKALLLTRGTNDMIKLFQDNPPKGKTKRVTKKIKPGKKLIETWTKQKEWLKKTQGESWFSKASTIAS